MYFENLEVRLQYNNHPDSYVSFYLRKFVIIEDRYRCIDGNYIPTF
jgi:hypothetical protein